MVTVDATLHGRPPTGPDVPVAVTEDGELRADPSIATEATLASILTELASKLEAGQAVALDAATLAALETVTAVISGAVAVSNFPASQPVTGPLTDAQLRANSVPVALDSTTLAALETITVLIQSGQVVGLDAASLAALESITAAVSGTVSVSGSVEITNDAGNALPVSGPLTNTQLRSSPVAVNGSVALDTATLAALEQVTVAIQSGQVVGLDAASLAALESINAAVSGTVAVSGSVEISNDAGNPLPVSGPLTDAQLRATPVPVSFPADESGLTNAELRASPVPVSGAVALDSATLAALETVTVLIQSGQVVGLDSASLAALESITAAVSGTVAVTGPLTDTELRAAPVPVSGPVTDAQLRATPLPVTFPVDESGLTNAELRAAPVEVDTGLVTQTDALTDAELRAAPVPVSGPVTDAELRATPLPVTFPAGEAGLTDEELRASPVPVSGPVTDAQLRATPLPVSGTVSVTEPVTVDGFPADFPDVTAQGTLASILTELGQKLEAGQAVALDAATLTALESITATVANWPGDFPDATAQATLASILTELGGKLDAGGTVALDAATLAALETIDIGDRAGRELGVVTGPLTDAQLRATPVPVSFPADESGLTDAQLRASPVPVTGTVAVEEPVTVDGFPAEYPLPAAQVTALTPPTDGLTDIELRAAPVVVDTGLSTQTDALTDVELRAAPVPVSGPVTDAELRAAPVAVTGTVAVSEPVTVDAVDLDIRPLNLTDEVTVVDAAEDATLLRAPFTLTAVGNNQVLVAAPGAGNGRLRLRRLSPTYAIRSPDSEPILSLKVGAAEAQRGNALTGRFDITAAVDTDAITLDVDVLDAGGAVVGTAYYEVVA